MKSMNVTENDKSCDLAEKNRMIKDENVNKRSMQSSFVWLYDRIKSTTIDENWHFNVSKHTVPSWQQVRRLKTLPRKNSDIQQHAKLAVHICTLK